VSKELAKLWQKAVMKYFDEAAFHLSGRNNKPEKNLHNF
jgi:hypothetical protein